MFRLLISLLGIIFLWKKIRNTIIYIGNILFGKTRDLQKIYGKSSYVLITGGSEGIGKAFAKEFAKRGFNLILMARNLTTLAEAQKEIQAEYSKVKVKIISFDFSKISEPENHNFISKFGLDSSEYDISIVVSNVGMSMGNFFEKISEEKLKQVINVNCASHVILSKQFRDYFELRNKNSENKNLRSAFIQTSSFCALVPFPFYDLYGATKMFNLVLNENLASWDWNVDFYTYMPGYVSTKLNNFRSGFFAIQPEESVREALINIGSERRVFCGHWKHELFGLILDLVPKSILGLNFVRSKLYKLKLKGYQTKEA